MLAFPVARVGHGANVEARLSSRRLAQSRQRERAAQKHAWREGAAGGGSDAGATSGSSSDARGGKGVQGGGTKYAKSRQS